MITRANYNKLYINKILNMVTMKKIIIVISVCLIVVACGVLAGLYIIGDKIIDETLDIELDDLQLETSVVKPDPDIVTSDEAEPEIRQKIMKDITSEQTQNVESIDDNTKPASGSANKQTTITLSKMKEVKEQVTAQDKISVAAMVTSKLSTGEIDKLKDMVSGGLTAEEKAEAKRIAFSNFSTDEIKKIKEIYYKYINN